MNFELLPNEMILEIFKYIDSIKLLDAFYGLNIRFNYLLYRQYYKYCFNFLDCSKTKFDMICHEHLPTIAKQVLCLNLEDCAETPGQIHLFLSYIPSFKSFTNLRTLRISHLYSHSLFMKIIHQLHYLSNLISLNFSACHCQNNPEDMQLMMDKIWNLPKLIYLYLNINFSHQNIFCLPTTISESIESLYLQIHIHRTSYNKIKQLLQYTPSLKYLQTSFDLDTYEHSQSCQFLTLTRLTIVVPTLLDPSTQLLFLQNLPNLRQLIVFLYSNIINGYQWEQLIENYLSKLKRFVLVMSNEYPTNRNIEEQANQLLNSFRSSFWIDKHKWYVHCIVQENRIDLRTSSIPFIRLDKCLPSLCKSTDPNDHSEKFFDRITTLYYPLCLNQTISSNSIRLTNSDYPSIRFPIDDQFWSIISSLNKLRSLVLLSYNDSFESQLQTLFDHASNLTNLTIRQSESLSLNTSLFQCTNTSIRKLDLIDYHHAFNEEECLTFSHSSLAIQCQILSIHVSNHESIVTLIQNMIHLQALHVKYGNYIPNQNQDETCDEVIQWLKDQLPPTCLVTQALKSINSVRIWIK